MTVGNRSSSNRVIVASPLERDEMRAYFQWVRLHPHIRDYILHIPNESKRSLSYGRDLKRQGMMAGVSDILIAIPTSTFHGCWIEMKRVGGKKPNPNQIGFLERMYERDYAAAICYGAEHAIKTTKEYLQDLYKL